ncbi:MAG: glycosyltransferase family 4 protein [Pyrinomonadaceae bacterium]
MRILQICSASSIGGGERHIADLSNSLADRGHEVLFAVRPDSPFVSLLTNVDRANVCRAEMRNAVGLISASKIAGFARRNHVDIIHAHIARDYPIAALASRLSGIPFVLTRHVLFPMKRLQRFVLHKVSAVIAPSTAVYRSLVDEAVIPVGKTVLIHNGIETGRFNAVPHTGARPFLVGTIGHLGKIKGHDIFVRAAAIVAKQKPEVQFVIIGDDKSRGGRDRVELIRSIAELEMGSTIKLIEWTDNIPAQLAQMDIFISAARSEPFGLAICEAMAAGVPVIATASEGAKEIIEHKVSGRLLTSLEPEELALAIMALADDEGERKKLGANGSRRILDQFSLPQMVDKTETLYQSVVKRVRQTAI